MNTDMNSTRKEFFSNFTELAGEEFWKRNINVPDVNIPDELYY